MKIITFILPLVLVLVLASCDKTKSKHWTEVKITVQNDITGEPIEDAFCGVYTQTGGVINGGVEELHTSNTANGVYEFGFKAKKNKTYWAEAIYDNDKYYNINFSTFMNLNNGTENEFLMTLVPYGNLNFDLKNVNCFDANDKIILNRFSETGYNGYSEIELNGCYEDSTGVFAKVPVGEWYLEWEVTKNSIATMFYDTIFLDENEYLIYELDY